MRRLFIVFLMFLLPLQSVWSAAATICSHEKTQSGERHFGHHEAHHEVPALPNASASDASAAAGVADMNSPAETDHHHALNVHPVSDTPSLAIQTIPAPRHVPAVSEPYPSALVASLERPPKTVADILRQRLRAHA